ncbi:hypothetical protein Hanom_Chr17g01544291 [Helianthus anomalus]
MFGRVGERGRSTAARYRSSSTSLSKLSNFMQSPSKVFLKFSRSTFSTVLIPPSLLRSIANGNSDTFFANFECRVLPSEHKCSTDSHALRTRFRFLVFTSLFVALRVLLTLLSTTSAFSLDNRDTGTNCRSEKDAMLETRAKLSIFFRLHRGSILEAVPEVDSVHVPDIGTDGVDVSKFGLIYSEGFKTFKSSFPSEITLPFCE